jgi:hypothetical protein
MCTRIAIVMQGFQEHATSEGWWKTRPHLRRKALDQQVVMGPEGWVITPNPDRITAMRAFAPTTVSKEVLIERLIELPQAPGCLWEPADLGNGVLFPTCAKSNIFWAINEQRVTFCNQTLRLAVGKGMAQLHPVPVDRLGRESRQMGIVATHLGLPSSVLTGRAAAASHAHLGRNSVFMTLSREALPDLQPKKDEEKQDVSLYAPVLRTRSAGGLSGLMKSLGKVGLETQTFPRGAIPEGFQALMEDTPDVVTLDANEEATAAPDLLEGPWKQLFMKGVQVFGLFSGPTKSSLREPYAEEVLARRDPRVICVKTSTMSAAYDALSEALADRDIKPYEADDDSFL